jgi:PAS domain S-box-containing protein
MDPGSPNRDVIFKKESIHYTMLRWETAVALMNALVNNPHIGVLIETGDRKILSLNTSFFETFGLTGSVDDYLGMDTMQMFEQHSALVSDPKKFLSHMTSMMKKGEMVVREEIRLADGRILERDYTPLVNNGFAAHLWQYRDVTERKRYDEQLQRRVKLMAEAQHLALLGSWDWDIGTNTVTWSDELYRIYGLTPQEIEPTYEAFLEHIHPDDRSLVKTAIEKAYSDHQPFSFSHKILRPDGSVRVLYVRGVVLEDAAHKPIRMVWTGLDVTDGLVIEEALKQSQQRYQELIDSVDGIVWEADAHLNITFVSKQAEPLLGYPVELWTHESLFWQNHVLPFDREMVLNRCQSALEKAGREEFEFRMVAADGRTIWLRCIVRGVSEGREKKLRGIMVDISERKNVEARLKESFEQLRNLAVRLQSVREEESTRIALEIHDELGQALTGLKMDLTWMNKKLPQGEKALSEKVASMLKLIDTTIHTVRRISTELRPGVLDDLGLVAALEWQTEEFERRTGIHCNVSLAEDSIDLEKEQSTAVFRIFQETLTNIARHAKAKKVTITLQCDAQHLYLVVIDDGIGIPLQKINDPHSMGLIGMRERAVFLGGKLSITSQPMQGTIVSLQVPLQGEHAPVAAPVRLKEKTAGRRTISHR